jgi:hypothetical protein
VTNRPGLIGGLLVGVGAAKALAYALKKPLIAIISLSNNGTVDCDLARWQYRDSGRWGNTLECGESAGSCSSREITQGLSPPDGSSE